VDFDGDGRIDLRGSPTDAVGSVARFLANHGWKTGQPTHFGAVLGDEARAKPAVDIGIPPRLSPKELAGYGVVSPQPLPEGEALALIDLPMGDAPTQYVLGAQNFYVITRYNRSYFYAMVVIDFAQELRTAAGLATARAQ
jgi:membrane-bound lytic murein transglycosylase B